MKKFGFFPSFLSFLVGSMQFLALFLVQKIMLLGHFLSFLDQKRHKKLGFELYELIPCKFFYTFYVMKM
jgi:hypothetical protein